MDERALMESFQRVTPRGDDRRGCPDASRLALLASGALTSEESEELVNHVGACSSCALEVRTAQSLYASKEEFLDDSSMGASGGAWQSWVMGVGAAVAAVLILGVSASIVTNRPESGASVSRQGGETDPDIRSLLEEARPLSREAFVLKWSSVDEDVHYDVRIVNEQLEVVYEARNVVETEHHVPVSALSTVSFGERVLWQVAVVLPDGARALSPTFFATVE